MLVVFASLVACIALAASYPPLTGRVVDQAGLLSAVARSGLEGKLQAFEDKSGIQFVVATVKSLEGNDIEPYANALFRNWKLGEKAKNNGVLLLVAPNERRVRFEVGYGLEGTLTDALSRLIIANAITPKFKAGDFSGGIERGVDDAIATLSGDASEWQKRPELREDNPQSPLDALMPILIFFMFALIVLSIMRGSSARQGQVVRGRGGNVIFIPSGGFGGGYSGGFGGGGGLGGGGFSGGGGSSGGGGASGGW